MNRLNRRAKMSHIQQLARREWGKFEPVALDARLIDWYRQIQGNFVGGYHNNLFAVQLFQRRVRIGSEEVVCRHLAISRHDQSEITGWETLQRIKNEIVGPETIAVEVFPKQSEVVNEANMRHLFTWDGCPFTILGEWA